MAVKISLNKKYVSISVYVLLVLAFAFLFALFIFNLGDIFSFLGRLLAEVRSILYGIVITFIQFPWVLMLEKLFGRIFAKCKKHKRKLVSIFSVVFAYLILAGILAIIVVGVIPPLTSSQDIIQKAFGDTVSSTTAFIERLRASSSILKTIIDETLEVVKGWVTANYSDQAFSIAGTLASETFNLIIGVIISIYFLLSRPMFNRIFGKITAAFLHGAAVPRVLNFCKRLYTDMMEFIFARLIGSLLVAILCYVGARILQIPTYLVIIISILIFIFTLIPYFGPFLATAISVLVVLLLDRPLHAWILLAIVVGLQILRHQAFTRFVLRKKLRPSPALALPLLIIGYGLLGFGGALIAIPLCATVEIEIREIMAHIFVRRGLPTTTEDYIGYDFRTAEFEDLKKEIEEEADTVSENQPVDHENGALDGSEQ